MAGARWWQESRRGGVRQLAVHAAMATSGADFYFFTLKNVFIGVPLNLPPAKMVFLLAIVLTYRLLNLIFPGGQLTATENALFSLALVRWRHRRPPAKIYLSPTKMIFLVVRMFHARYRLKNVCTYLVVSSKVQITRLDKEIKETE